METITGYLLDFFSFVIVLGVAVTIHEGGHFIVAILSGIRVERFSIGFGKPLFKVSFRTIRRWLPIFGWLGSRRDLLDETEFVVAPIPLGGYVKMAGENPNEVTGEPDEFFSKSPWGRIPTILAGPFANIIGAFVIFFSLAFLFGNPYQPNEIGSIVPRSPGYQAGLRKGDKIVRLGDQPIENWSDFRTAYYAAQDSDKTIVGASIIRGTETLELDLPAADASLDDSLVLSFPDPVGPAFEVGLREGDRVLDLAGKDLTDWRSLQTIARGLWEDTPSGPQAKTVSVGWETAEGEIRRASLTPALVTDSSAGMIAMLGISPAGLGISPRIPPVVDRKLRGFPAAELDIKPGALIVAVNGQTVQDAEDIERQTTFSYRFEEVDGESRPVPIPIELSWRNPDANQIQTATIMPRLEKTPKPDSLISLQHGKQFYVAQMGIAYREPSETLGMVASLKQGVAETIGACKETVFVLKGLITGAVSHKLIGGPVMIAQLSARIGKQGFRRLFWLCAMLQANLALLNLLPIPVLDGGQIVIALCEGVSRRRFSLRQMEIIQYVGLAILLPLFAMVFLNDFARVGLFDWIKELFT